MDELDKAIEDWLRWLAWLGVVAAGFTWAGLSQADAAASGVLSTNNTGLEAPSAGFPFTNSLIRPAQFQNLLGSNGLGSALSGVSGSNAPMVLSARNENEARFTAQLESARRQQRARNVRNATRLLLGVVNNDAPEGVKRRAWLDLARFQDEENQWAKALQCYAEFLGRYPNDPIVPEILLRQGLLCRKLGVPSMALDKYHAVLGSALSFGLERLEYYQNLVLLAQTEIAETYYAEKRYEEALMYLNRLLKLDHPDLNRLQVHYKLVRAFAALGRTSEVITHAHDFLDRFPADAPEHAEVRFFLIGALRKAGKDEEALEQVRLLLASQQANASVAPSRWAYWQRRAGQEFAQYCFEKGAWTNALMVYLGLSQLDNSASWQAPIWYQIGLVQERLQQPAEASQMYGRILERESELGAPPPPGLSSLLTMAKWRRQYLAWQTRTEVSSRDLETAVSLERTPATPGGSAP